jgi:hypothetical protein
MVWLFAMFGIVKRANILLALSIPMVFSNYSFAATKICWRSADPHNNYLKFQDKTASTQLNTDELKDGDASHNLSPAELIYYSAKENDINPVLLLAKLQDEQSLLTQGKNHGDFEHRLERATGYGIRDTSPSDDWLGFYPQLVGSTYQWHLYRESSLNFKDAYEKYTTGEGKYTGFTQEDGLYADVAKNMNAVAGTTYEVQPESTGYYNDFRKNITITHIQKFLELADYSGGALNNEKLFREPPIEKSQVTYTCGGCYPFSDVCPGDWYFVPVMLLWKLGIISTGDGDFLPYSPVSYEEFLSTTELVANMESTSLHAAAYDYEQLAYEPISRADAIMVIATTFLPDTLQQFQDGRKPDRLFNDVKNREVPYYNHVYAAQAENVTNGTSDGNFKPNQYLTRGEMAKFICLAGFDPMECIDIGDPDRSSITNVQPEEPLTSDESPVEEPLPEEPLPNEEPIACGETTVTSVSPLTATIDLPTPTTFTVEGTCLSENIVMWIDGCEGIVALGGSETERSFKCTPNHKGGSHDGEIKDTSKSIVLKSFVVDFKWGTPSVKSVSPTTATFGEMTIFTVKGASLTPETVLWIDKCDGSNTSIGGTSLYRDFQCKPIVSSTLTGLVKDKSGGNELYKFSVNVQ